MYTNSLYFVEEDGVDGQRPCTCGVCACGRQEQSAPYLFIPRGLQHLIKLGLKYTIGTPFTNGHMMEAGRVSDEARRKRYSPRSLKELTAFTLCDSLHLLDWMRAQTEIVTEDMVRARILSFKLPKMRGAKEVEALVKAVDTWPRDPPFGDGTDEPDFITMAFFIFLASQHVGQIVRILDEDEARKYEEDNPPPPDDQDEDQDDSEHEESEYEDDWSSDSGISETEIPDDDDADAEMEDPPPPEPVEMEEPPPPEPQQPTPPPPPENESSDDEEWAEEWHPRKRRKLLPDGYYYYTSSDSE